MTLLCGLKSQIAFVQTNGFFHEIVVTIFHNMFIFCLPVFFLFCCFTFLHKRKEPLNIFLGRISDLKLNTQFWGSQPFNPCFHLHLLHRRADFLAPWEGF